MIQLAMSPASSRAQRCSVTASLNVLLSRSSLVTAVTMSIRRVIEEMFAPGGRLLEHRSQQASLGAERGSRARGRVRLPGIYLDQLGQHLGGRLWDLREEPGASSGRSLTYLNPTGGDVALTRKDPPGRHRPGGSVISLANVCYQRRHAGRRRVRLR
jgi:hypothetical protein